ncbi:TetR family transcriptional regulator [Rhodobacter sp. JA431]|uniref:CerR family C-terminal domain-containing protein n=1 Tax=Rhodobacter sp. JA431 TaxID=570013 RepID=UPI000BDA4EEC|nr:CerR family C-terminal domain-containing protein [Rhodobacter sp. JA431]SOC07929.1 TetR family transcriptional regulator [Rhodobacter sp. JA431]
MIERVDTKSVSLSDPGTAGALVRAAIAIFGQKGFDATSTREIAAAAQTNVASIAYHFGGKDGLRRACAAAFASHIGGLLNLDTLPEPETPQAAEALILTIVERFAAHMIADHDMQSRVAFMLREVASGGSGLDSFYEQLVVPSHTRFCRLWETATGEPANAETTKLLIFTALGQILYFRIGAPVVTRRMGWTEIGPEETASIVAILKSNITALIAQHRRSSL